MLSGALKSSQRASQRKGTAGRLPKASSRHSKLDAPDLTMRGKFLTWSQKPFTELGGPTALKPEGLNSPGVRGDGFDKGFGSSASLQTALSGCPGGVLRGFSGLAFGLAPRLLAQAFTLQGACE